MSDTTTNSIETEAMALLRELGMEDVLFYAVPSNCCWLTRAGGPKVFKPWAAFRTLWQGQLIDAQVLGHDESIVQYTITAKGRCALAVQTPEAESAVLANEAQIGALLTELANGKHMPEDSELFPEMRRRNLITLVSGGYYTITTKGRALLTAQKSLEYAMEALPFKGAMFLNLIGGYSGYHYWPGAPESKYALSDPHMHTFRFEVVLKPSKDREIEFLVAADALGEHMEQWLEQPANEASSCELMAVILAGKAWDLFQLPVMSSQVAEDDHSAALWVGDCKHARPWCVLAHNELGEYFDSMGMKDTPEGVMEEAMKLADDLAADISEALKGVDPNSTDQIRIDIHLEATPANYETPITPDNPS